MMNNNIVFKRALQDHGPAIHQLIAEVLGGYGIYHVRPEYVDQDIDDLDTNFFNNNGYFWVVENGVGTLIASVAIYRIDDHTCELRKMYLKVNEQGKGIGRMLFQTAIAKANELGYTKMGLKTNSKLQTAIAMYKKYGFEFDAISECDKKADCDVSMFKML
ncbi:MAG: GNAT family N-acetyltransferase [Bacteroidetes bacterium]|nr:GNAT family N-acetyltransferase [Bacteroidota bacterium]